MLTENEFSPLDNAFANFLIKHTLLTGDERVCFENTVKQLSSQQNQGHNCLYVNAATQRVLQQSGLVNVAGISSTLKPLVLESNRLYLQRYWAYEQELACQLHALSQHHYALASVDTLLDTYFPPSEGIDWQREAAKLALTERLSIITGGPGTGKTSTVVKILALLQSVASEPLLIALAAPTGKAALRLQTSLGQNAATLACSAALKATLPRQVSTLHRLLGVKFGSATFRHNASKPLIYDVIVIDEASMIDLALMAKLVFALKPTARLLLLGDKDQLASVESGAVLADLTHALPAHTIELKRAHRFNNDIKQLAEAINKQHAKHAWQQLNAATQTLHLLTQAQLIPYIASEYSHYLQLIKTGADFLTIYDAFNRLSVLCANRQGKNSVTEINYLVEQALFAEKHINLTSLWYVGRPVMITQNNSALQLYNGDIGLCLLYQHTLMVHFQHADGTIKRYLPARITHCETVYAMTIHKSQGSEFETVIIALPETMNRALTKELLYTAVTRAKQNIYIRAEKEVFMQTIQQKVERLTGLADKLSALQT